jgi:PAS domain S-box-containing protein
VLLIFLVGAAYYAASLISLAFPVPPDNISVIWIPNSVLVIALLLFPARFRFILFAAVLPVHYLAQVQSGESGWMIFWTYITNCGLAYLAGTLTQKFTGADFRFGDLRSNIVYIGFAGLLAPAFMAFVGVGFIDLMGYENDYWLISKQVFFSNAVGFLILIPAFVANVDEGRNFFKEILPKRNTEAALLAWTLLFSLFLAHETRNITIEAIPVGVFILLPVILWASLRFGVNVSAGSALIVTLFCVWNFLHRQSLSGPELSAGKVMELQFFLILISFLPLLLSVRVGKSRIKIGSEENHNAVESNQIEQTLNESGLGQSFLKALPDMVFLIHEDGTYLDYHAINESELLVPPEVFLRRNVREIMPGGIADEVFGYFAAAKRSDAPQCFEYGLEINENKHIFECRIVLSGNDTFLCIVRNITEQRLAEKALRQSEEFNRRIIESSNDCIKMLDLEGNLIYINQRGRELLEIEDDSCIGSQWLGFWGELDQPALKVEIDKAKAGGIGRFQGYNPTAKGSVKWWDVLISPITDTDGGIERLLVISRDITEQKLAVEKLLLQERFFRSLIENAHDIITVLSTDGTIIYESPAVKRLMGYEPEERIGQNCFSFIHPDDLDRIKTTFAEVIESDTPSKPVQYRYQHKDGHWVDLEVIGRFTHNDAGEPIIVVNKRDITDRNRAQESLRESEERFYSFMEQSPAGAWVTDEEGYILYINPVSREALHLPNQNVSGKSTYEIFPKDLAQRYCSDIKLAAETGLPVERLEELPVADGTMGSFLVYRFCISRQEIRPRLVGGFAIEITEQTRVKKALSDSEQKYRRIVDTMLEGIWIVDSEARITLINRQLAEMLGYEVDELIGRPAYEFFAEESQDDVPQIRERRRQGISEYYDTKLRPKTDRFFGRLARRRLSLTITENIAARWH